MSNNSVMSNSSTTSSPMSFISTIMQTSTSNSIRTNDTLYNKILNLLNGTDLYKHQMAYLIEPEKYSARGMHIIIWSMCIITYLIAIPVAVRIVRSKSYLNVIDYFSFHLIICAFIDWVPSLILILYQRFQSFTLKFCRFHYIVLSTNETVPIFFVLYMIVERFFYAHPYIKQKYTQFSRMYFIHLYAIFTWLLVMVFYALASPFSQGSPDPLLAFYTKNFCPYNYQKLRSIATARSIIYFCLLIPGLVLIGFVLRYFYLMRGTNQVLPIQKLWTIRVTALLCMIVFYDIYIYYLEHVAETFRSFLLSSILRSTFFTVQICIIVATEPYWIEFLFERLLCFCCLFTGQRRKATTPVSIPVETEFHTLPFSLSAGHYSLVDDTVADEFDTDNSGPEPTLRIIV